MEVAVTVVLPSAGTSTVAIVVVQLPEPSGVIARETVPQVSSTEAPGFALPLMTTPAARSVPFTMSSAVTLAMTITDVLSMTTTRDADGPTFPAASVAAAVTVEDGLSGGTSPDAKCVLQAPFAPATTLCVTVPQVTATVAPASAVPLTVTPAAFSAPLTMSLVDTGPMTGATGAIVSTARV